MYPLDGIIGDKGVPFHIILKRVEKITFLIRWVSLGGIWKNSSVFWINNHSRQSYAFSRFWFIDNIVKKLQLAFILAKGHRLHLQKK